MAESNLIDCSFPYEDDNVCKLREKQREEHSVRRKQHVFEKLCVKRHWGDTSQSKPMTKKQVHILSCELKRCKTATSLQQLNQAFSNGSQEMIDTFLSVDGALFALVGCLIGKNEELQCEATVCLVNLATGNHSSTKRIIKSAAPYLIAYLSSGNSALKELSAWALGNMAADCCSCCKVLRVQGLPSALCHLLESPHESVIASSCFALACYTLASDDDSCYEVVNCTTLSFLGQHLQAAQQLILSEVANIVYHLSCRNQFDIELLQAGLTTLVVSKLALMAEAQPDNLMILTPLTRAVGNLASGETLGCLLSHPDFSQLILRLLTSRYYHIKKETLWLVANIAAGGATGAAFICQVSILQKVIEMVDAMGQLGSQALICLCNLSSIQESCKAIGLQKPYSHIENVLHQPDTKAITCSMTLLLHMLQNTPLTIEMDGCIQALHSLQHHNMPEISRMATHLLGMSNVMDLVLGHI